MLYNEFDWFGILLELLPVINEILLNLLVVLFHHDLLELEVIKQGVVAMRLLQIDQVLIQQEVEGQGQQGDIQTHVPVQTHHSHILGIEPVMVGYVEVGHDHHVHEHQVQHATLLQYYLGVLPFVLHQVVQVVVIGQNGELLVGDVSDVLDVGLYLLDGRSAQLHELELGPAVDMVGGSPVLVVLVQDVLALQLDLLQVLATGLGQLQHVVLLLQQAPAELHQTRQGDQHEHVEEHVVHQGPVEHHDCYILLYYYYYQ